MVTLWQDCQSRYISGGMDAAYEREFANDGERVAYLFEAVPETQRRALCGQKEARQGTEGRSDGPAGARLASHPSIVRVMLFYP